MILFEIDIFYISKYLIHHANKSSSEQSMSHIFDFVEHLLSFLDLIKNGPNVTAGI